MTITYYVDDDSFAAFDEAICAARALADLRLERGSPGCRSGVAVKAMDVYSGQFIGERVAFIARPTTLVLAAVAARGLPEPVEAA